MKICKRILSILLAATAIALPLVSCSDNDGDVAGPPVIENVRVTNPEKADSTFTMAAPGTMIAIMGRNLRGATALYINDQSVSFNPNMNTDKSLIAVIPSEVDGFKLTVWNPELPNEIRLVTRGGEARYEFKVLSPVPSLKRIAAPYPRREGDHLKLYGDNFLDIERIYFSDVNPYPEVLYDDNGNPIHVEVEKGTEIDATDYEITKLERYLDKKTKTYVTESEMDLVLPTLPFTTGYLVIETPQGATSLDFSKLPPLPVMTGISSDMPVAGSKVIIKGLYFVNVSGVKIGDSLSVTDVEVSEDEAELSFIMPAKPDKTTTISVVTESGESNRFYFYNYETVLIDFDGMGFDEGHSPAAIWAEPATADKEPYISDGRYALIEARNPGQSWWGTMIRWRANEAGTPFNMPGFDIIPAETPASEVYLMFECYLRNQFTKTLHSWIHDVNDVAYEWTDWDWSTGTQIEPELMGAFGEQLTGTWYTAYIPLSKFATGDVALKDMNYAQICELKLHLVRLMLNNYTEKSEKVFLCVDNIRVGLKQTFTPKL